jgi:hypothetical protein
MNGWIKIHRSITNHWLYTEKRVFSRFEAWNDILLTVNYTDAKTIIKGSLYEVKRGQSILSLDSWSKRWNWDKSKVRRFLNTLQLDNMVVIKSDTVTTQLTVCNYDSYQGERNADEPQMKHERNAGETQVNTIEERKKEKKEITIPSIDEFLAYSVSQIPNINKQDVEFKYKSWLVNDWCVNVDGKQRKISNWKTTLLNTLRYLRTDQGNVYSPNIIHE